MAEGAVPADHKRTIKKNANVVTVYIANDQDLALNYSEISEELQLAEFLLRDEGYKNDEEHLKKVARLKKEEAGLRKQMRETSLVFKFRSIGRKAVDELIEAHPPSDEQKKRLKEMGEAEDSITWDADSFAPALCAAAILEPKGFKVAEAFEDPDWNAAELGALFNAALEANQSRRVVPLGNA